MSNKKSTELVQDPSHISSWRSNWTRRYCCFAQLSKHILNNKHQCCFLCKNKGLALIVHSVRTAIIIGKWTKTSKNKREEQEDQKWKAYKIQSIQSHTLNWNTISVQLHKCLCRFHNQHNIESMEVQAAKASEARNKIVTTY